MADARSRSVELRYTDVGGRAVTTTLAEAEGHQVVRGRPVRSFPTCPGQQNYPGLLWSATTSSLIGYESLLERLRRHVPDSLLETDQGFLVVDVKPAVLLDHPKVAEQLAWCGQLCADAVPKRPSGVLGRLRADRPGQLSIRKCASKQRFYRRPSRSW